MLKKVGVVVFSSHDDDDRLTHCWIFQTDTGSNWWRTVFVFKAEEKKMNGRWLRHFTAIANEAASVHFCITVSCIQPEGERWYPRLSSFVFFLQAIWIIWLSECERDTFEMGNRYETCNDLLTWLDRRLIWFVWFDCVHLSQRLTDSDPGGNCMWRAIWTAFEDDPSLSVGTTGFCLNVRS